jgi:hypothetical protein
VETIRDKSTEAEQQFLACPLGLAVFLLVAVLWLPAAKAASGALSSIESVGSSDAATAAGEEFSGRVVDPNGRPVAGAQVVLTAQLGELVLRNAVLEKWSDADGDKVQFGKTDAEGRFRFKSRWSHPFYVLVAHPSGFGAMNGKEFQKDHEIRLKRWGRIEGQVAKGRGGPDHRVWMVGLPSPAWVTRRCEVRYDTLCSADGRFVFEKVPSGWFEIGYPIAIGDDFDGLTARTAVVVKAGETARVKVGGEGRPVIGRFVPPASCGKPVYFGAGPRTLRRNEKIERDERKVAQLRAQQPEDDPYASDVLVFDPRTAAYAMWREDVQQQWGHSQASDDVADLPSDAI